MEKFECPKCNDQKEALAKTMSHDCPQNQNKLTRYRRLPRAAVPATKIRLPKVERVLAKKAAAKKASPTKKAPASKEAAKASVPVKTVATPVGPVARGELPKAKSGELKAAILAHLLKHPNEQHSPTSISKALDGRSSGAINNSLVKMVESGTVRQTQAKPKRFQAASKA